MIFKMIAITTCISDVGDKYLGLCEGNKTQILLQTQYFFHKGQV